MKGCVVSHQIDENGHGHDCCADVIPSAELFFAFVSLDLLLDSRKGEEAQGYPCASYAHQDAGKRDGVHAFRCGSDILRGEDFCFGKSCKHEKYGPCSEIECPGGEELIFHLSERCWLFL